MKNLFSLSLGSALLFLHLNLSSEQKPNIILFLVDDMGLMDTSVPMLTDKEGKPQKHPLNDWYRTPNMERLAKQGVRFSQFYAQSVCSPTRASIMTGQNSARHRVTQFISPESKERWTSKIGNGKD
ncbi:MAG: sulfatase-like hydrolase/transferase [Opitutales bacterium]